MRGLKKLRLKLKYDRILNGGTMCVTNNNLLLPFPFRFVCNCKTIFCFCDLYNIFRKSNIDFDVNDDKSINIKGDITINSVNIPLKFNKVYGSFKLAHDKTETLKNSPNEVYGDFISNKSNISSLVGAPKIVHGLFKLRHSNIRTLNNLPICNSLDMSYNKINYIDRELPSDTRLDYNPIFDYKILGTYMQNIYGSPFYKFVSLLYKVLNQNNLLISYNELIFRINEFDIIVDTYTIDKLNLESLLRYYGLEIAFDFSNIFYLYKVRE